MAESKLDRYVRTIPKVFKPQTNPIIRALLKAWALTDDDIVTQLQNTKAELFVKTADGQYLDRLASGLGVSRPAGLGLLDPDFQNLIPNLSLKPKQIRKIFYDTMDVFWGPLFSRSNVQTANAGPYNVSPGDSLTVIIDGGAVQTIKVLSSDIAVPGAATANEVANVLSRISGATVSIITDQATGLMRLNIRTNTPGPQGSIQFTGGTLLGGTKLNLPTNKMLITSLPQRTVIYELRNKEIIIELPAIVPALRRTLRGSHHFHSSTALEPPVAPSNAIWQGSFLYSLTGVSYTVTSQSAKIQEVLSKGNVYTKVTVDNAANIPNAPGTLIFDWGRPNEEQPVNYISRPNNNTILLDAGHVFLKTHSVGANINVLVPSLKPYTPRTTGQDLPIYLTSPSGARQIVQTLLQGLAAAGVTVTFIILLPKYQYLKENPYQSV